VYDLLITFSKFLAERHVHIRQQSESVGLSCPNLNLPILANLLLEVNPELLNGAGPKLFTLVGVANLLLEVKPELLYGAGPNCGVW
jgi:hypothetical protein